MRLRWVCFACTLLGIAQAQTGTEKVIHAFTTFPQGANPYGPLARDTAGNLYGTTNVGGATNMGAVFELTASGKYRVLYSFKGGSDGANPYAGVTLDSSGNLFGTTYGGGGGDQGVVYKITSGRGTILHAFTGGTDGSQPYAGVILDSSGNLYGTTYAGGAANAGTVYKVNPSGQETVLYSFTGGTDGGNPYAGVIADPQGNLYGTTYQGGAANAGVVYELDPNGRETVLYTFAGLTSPGRPYAGVIRDSAGNLYGTAVGGLGGVIYELGTASSLTVLYQFPAGFGPQKPESCLARDGDGNLYGTTQHGGRAGVGVVYKLDTTGHFTTLYSFPGGPPTEGFANFPNAGVVLDSTGNLYGTTPYAGVAGMVYKLSQSGQETTLYSFPGAPGGTTPSGGVVRDTVGNLYGATATGGPANAGVVYKLDATGHLTALYNFTGGADGANPGGGLIEDKAGNLYGATSHGGVARGDAGFGVVYKVDVSGRQSVLYRFSGGADGGLPDGGVVLDLTGKLYGTTFEGGTAGAGVVYKLDASGHQSVLYTFTGGVDGGYPYAGVVLDSAGNLYGTTDYGGVANAGVVYKLSPSGQETVLHSFTGFGAGGGNPHAGVILDRAGNVYGTTVNFGTTAGGAPGSGVVFRLDAKGNYTVLYTFTGGTDGGLPLAGVIGDSAGNLYGTTSAGGAATCYPASGCGVVYKLDPSGHETVFYSFTGGADGAQPYAGLAADAVGNLYGTTPWGGIGGSALVSFSGGGVVYKISPK